MLSVFQVDQDLKGTVVAPFRALSEELSVLPRRFPVSTSQRRCDGQFRGARQTGDTLHPSICGFEQREDVGSEEMKRHIHT